MNKFGLMWIVCLAFVVACGGAQSAGAEAEEGDGTQGGGDTSSAVVPNSVKVEQGFTRIENACAKDAEERCNGADDNCNGEIDESCKLEQGALHVALTWNSDADLDLHVIDPNGEALSQQHRETSSGGHLQHDGRGACTEQQMQRVESAYFEAPLKPGTYIVEMAYWGECAASGITTASVTMVEGGKLHGVFNGEISPGERKRAFAFSVR